MVARSSSYTTLRKANEGNRLVCYDRSGFPVQQAFSVECTQVGNLDRVKQNMQIEAQGGDRRKPTRCLPSSKRTARA